jgi:hypothetical protein
LQKNLRDPKDSKIQNSATNNRHKVLDFNLQKKYRSGVRMLVNIAKYSRPDNSNVKTELSKCIVGAIWGAYHEFFVSYQN